MALTTNKRNKILNEWKAGAKSYNSLAKKHKVSVNTVKKICKDVPKANADIVAKGVEYELMKKSIKDASEIKVIERAVQERVNTLEDDNFLVKNNRALLKALHSKIAEEIKSNAQTPQDIKHITGAIKDIESVANPRTQQTNIQVNNTVEIDNKKEKLEAIRKRLQIQA